MYNVHIGNLGNDPMQSRCDRSKIKKLTVTFFSSFSKKANLAGKNVSEMTHFVSSGTKTLNSITI